MRYSHRKQLERWARLQLAISIARTARDGAALEHNVGRVDRVDSSNLFKSTGWRALRKWFNSLSRMAQNNAVRWMRFQLEGVDKIKRAIEAEGGAFDPSVDLADIEFTLRADAPPESVSAGTAGNDNKQQEQQEHVRESDHTDEPQQRPDADEQAQA